MTIKPLNRTKGVLSSAHSPHHRPKLNIQVVKKKLNLKNQEIFLVEGFLIPNPRTKILPDKFYHLRKKIENNNKKVQSNLMIKHSKKLKNFIRTLFQ